MEIVQVHYVKLGQFTTKMGVEKLSFKVTNEADVEFGSDDYYKVEVASENVERVNQILSSLEA